MLRRTPAAAWLFSLAAAVSSACASSSGSSLGLPGASDAGLDGLPGDAGSPAEGGPGADSGDAAQPPADSGGRPSDSGAPACPALSLTPVTLTVAIDPPTAGIPVRIDATGNPGAANTSYVDLAFAPAGSATASWIGVTGGGPWTWSWSVTFASAGPVCVTFTSGMGASSWGNRAVTVLPGAGDAGGGGVVTPSGAGFAFPDGAAGFVGMNTRGLPHYGTAMLPYASVAQIDAQLAAAQAVGARVVRVFAAAHDASPAVVAARLGVVLDAAKAHGLTVIAALTDFYATGFSPQGDDGAYQNVGGYTILADAWFAGGYKASYLPWVDAVVPLYRSHPALFAWELGNEIKDNTTPANYVSFAHAVAAHLRALDPVHMITTGAISTLSGQLRSPGDVSTGTLAYGLYSDPNVSFLTTHDYHGQMSEDDTDLARALGKPIIIEEEGYATSDGDRPSLTLANGGAWRSKGARGYMQWGFVALTQDNGDGDATFGMDEFLHQADWAGLSTTYATLAGQYR